MAQHLAVDEPHQVLLHLLGEGRLAAQLGLQRRDLAQDDAVLLLLGPRLPDGLDQLKEVAPGQVRPRDGQEAVGQVRHAGKRWSACPLWVCLLFRPCEDDRDDA